jgi:hypothetical protein
MEIKFFADPAHGWGEVPMSMIKELGIADKISHYSYMKGEMAYLEEDCDLSLFINALEAKGVPYEFAEFSTNYDSPVRRYQSYKVL